MIPMKAKNHLRARVARCVFTKVASNKNESRDHRRRDRLAVQPSKTVMEQMDAMAQQVWSACTHDERTASCSRTRGARARRRSGETWCGVHRSQLLHGDEAGAGPRGEHLAR